MSTPEERLKKARFAAYEIIDTEKTYLSRLRGVYDVYVIPLMKSRLLDDNDFDLQFGCWNTIFDVSERFYNSLQALRVQENPQLGPFFAAFVEDKDFGIYKKYLVRFEMALNRRGIILTSNKKYASFVNDVWNDPRCFSFSLESLLTEPVARIPRYKMLLEQLLKYTDESTSDYQLLKTSLGKIAEIASENNEAIRARENRQKIMDVMQTIDAKTRINLLDTPTRWFIRCGNLQRQCRRQIKEFMFWLFSDKLLYGETLGGMGVETFNLNRVISLMECRVTNDAVLPMVELLDRAFTIQSPAKSFVVIAKTAEDKDNWMKCINDAIHKVRQSVEASTGHIAPVWMPDKAVTHCQNIICKKQFTVIRRRHHCRNCGSILCNDCSSTRVILRHVNAKSPVRVCGSCHDTLRTDPNFGAMNSSKSGSGSARSVYSSPRSDDTLDTPALLKVRSQMLDEIDGSRKSAVAREEDDDMSPGENCCYVCVSEFSLFKKKQTCMNCGFNVCADCSRKKFLIAAVDPKNEVRVCNFCHITLSSGVGVASTYETGATVAESASQNPPTKPVRPVSLTAIKSTPSTPVSGSGSSSQVSSQNSSPATSPVSKPVPPPPPPRPDASSKQGAFTYKNQRSSVKLNPKLFSSAFDITSHIKTRYSVIDQIVSYLFSSSKFSKNIKMLTNGGVTSSPMKNTSMSTGSPMMQSPTMQQQQQRKDLCRCCSLHFDDKVHKRAECKNCMLNVCEACTKKEFSLPHIDPYSNSKVCNKCHLFLSSLSGPELQKIYAHLGNQSMINHGASSESSSQNRSFSTSEVDDRSVTPTRKKMFNLFGNAESGNKPLAKPTDTSRSLSPLRMLATPTGRSYSAVSPSNGNLISRAKFGATLPQREGSSSSPGQGGGSSVPTTGSNGNDSPGTNRQSFGQRSVPSPTISQQVATNSFGLSSSDPSRSTLLDRSPK